MVRQARELVTVGKIGNINQIHVEFLQDWMVPEEALLAPHVQWRLDPKISGPTSCVGDIGTHAAHLAQFVSSLKLTDVKAEFHVCGAPKALEVTAFIMTRYEGGVPGTLLATRLATGKRGGLNLRIYGSKGGIEWNLESSEELKLSVYGKPDRTISRGRIEFRGHPIQDLIGTVTFPQMIWLMIKGDLPSLDEAALFEAALVAAVDHGPQAPSIAAARMAITCGLSINNAMGSAVNMLGDIHGGAGEQCAELFYDIDEQMTKGLELQEAVKLGIDYSLAIPRR